MKAKLREEAVKLRLEQRLSYLAIRKKLGVSKSTLGYWLKDFPLTREEIKELQKLNWTKHEASRERYRIRMREKKEAAAQIAYEEAVQKLRSITKETRYVAGLMLYLAEGDKRNIYRTGIANTDWRLIRFFLLWTKEFLDVDPIKVKAQLHLYENMDIAIETQFWSDKLGFNQAQFYKPSVRPMRPGSYSYRESFRHGTCSLYISGIDRHTKLMAGINAWLDRILEK